MLGVVGVCSGCVQAISGGREVPSSRDSSSGMPLWISFSSL